MTLDEILKLSSVWKRLLGNNRVTRRGTRRLQEQLAERKRKFVVLERLGLGKHAVENLYEPPVDPKEKR